MNTLEARAVEMLERAYCPYSNHPVGAALECADGTVYTGCNVENAAFGPSICAERTAIVKAVSEGHRDFKRIAIAGKSEMPCVPCGVCRQVLAEFGGPDLRILLTDESGQIRSFTLAELLPETFWPEVLLGAGEETEQ